MTTSVAEAGQRLLQDDQPFDVAVLDGIVAAAYEPRHPIIVELARRATEEVLHQSLMVAVRHQFPCIGSVGCVLHTTGPMMCAAAR